MQALLSGLRVLVLLLVGIAGAQADWLGWAGKSGRTGAGAVASTGKLLGQLTGRQVLAASSVLGTGLVLVETRGGRLVMESADAGAQSLSGPVDDLGKLADKARSAPSLKDGARFILTRETAIELGPQLEPLAHGGRVYVVEPVLGPMRVVSRPRAGKPALFKELRPGVLTPIGSRLSEEVASALTEPVRREEMLVVSMYAKTDVDALQRLSLAAGDRLLDASAFLSRVATDSLETLRGKTVVLVGHVEDAAFVARGARGEVGQSLHIPKLEALAAQADVRIISAGCSSFCAGARTGFSSPVTDIDVADGVRAAFEARTTGDLLGGFGRKHPLVVSQDALDGFAQSRLLQLAADEAHSGKVSAGAMTVRIALRKEAFAGVLAALQTLAVWYLIGAVSMLLMFRSSRGAFLGVFPKLPSPDLPQERPRYMLAWAGRELLFATVGPVFGALTVFTFFAGGWSERRAIQSALWRCVRHPVDGGLVVLRFLGLYLLILAGYLLTVAALMAPGVAITFAVLGQKGQPLFWPLLTGCLLYWAVASWVGLKAYRRFQAWLQSR